MLLFSFSVLFSGIRFCSANETRISIKATNELKNRNKDRETEKEESKSEKERTRTKRI